MSMRRPLLFVFTFLTVFCSVSLAQDTIRMMQYNLMYYTNNSGISDCNPTTNNLETKDAALKTIFKYVQPTVLCVNEMGPSMTYVNRILNNVINTDGVDYYSHGLLTNYSGGNIANMVFYDTRKLTLCNNYYITTSYRDINGYRFYYNSNELQNGDTVFMTFWVAHLKAGNGYESVRDVQVRQLLQRIESMGAPGNVVFSGDFNMVGSEEAAYQTMINYENSLYRFYDPIQQEGHWNNNAQFASVHTQSTRTSSDGCFVTGGLDDRFDLVMVSQYLYYGIYGMQVLTDSYHALGQDGERFNGSIVSPQNNSVPSAVSTALYQMSDHLPVIVDFTVNATTGIADRANNFMMQVVNPVRDNLQISLQTEEESRITFEIYAVNGQLLSAFDEQFSEGRQTITLPFDFPKGIYVLKATNDKHQQFIQKIVR